MNDRVDVALAVSADAVQRTHVSLAVDDIRALAGRRLRIGASVHSLDGPPVDAQARGPTAVVFGARVRHGLKRQYGAPQGLERLAAVARAVQIPVVAIGGITPERGRGCARGRRPRRGRDLGDPVGRSPAEATRASWRWPLTPVRRWLLDFLMSSMGGNAPHCTPVSSICVMRFMRATMSRIRSRTIHAPGLEPRAGSSLPGGSLRATRPRPPITAVRDC